MITQQILFVISFFIITLSLMSRIPKKITQTKVCGYQTTGLIHLGSSIFP